MSALLRGVFITAAKRTPLGTFGGRLKDLSAINLGVVSSKAALEAASVPPELINSVTVGNVIQSSTIDGAYISRTLALMCDIPKEVPCLTVNRLCGSGFQAVVTGAQEICLRESEIVLAVGAENMSQSPFVARNIRFGVRFMSEPKLECVLWGALIDHYIKMPMGITAENLADKYNISREDADKFAYQSQMRWKKAHENGYFKDQIVPLTIKLKGKENIFDFDEHSKPNTTLEDLAKLPPVFKEGGIVTAGNASGISDGASSLILASEDAIEKHKLKPLARIVGYSVVGCDPTIMGIGPVPAIQKLCDQTDVKIEDVDLFEVNEAFAPQALAVEKALGLDPSKTNVNGGAIALGHPVGASGARITTNLVHELRRRGGKYAIGSACIGGGQGIALMLENVK